MSVDTKEVKSIATFQGYNRDEIALIKNTIAKGATDDELRMFLYLAKQYGLDPFKKEIFFIKFRNKNGKDTVTMQTSRDGYLKIAMQDSGYAGLQSFVVCEGDTFKINAGSEVVTHEFGAKRGKIMGAWAIAYHKTRRPFICFVPYNEYVDTSKESWIKYPSAMIQKVAEAFVLKRQFNINGLVTQEEMGTEEIDAIQNLQITDTSSPVEKIEPEKEYLKPAIETIKKLAKKAKMNEEQMLESLHINTGLETLEELDAEAGEFFIYHLENVICLFKIIKERNIPQEIIHAKVTKKSYEMDFDEIEKLIVWAENYQPEVDESIDRGEQE